MKVRGSRSLDELRRLQREEKDAGRAQRLQIIVLDLHGWTAPAVAMAVGLSCRICQRWVARYNEFGLDDQRGRDARLLLTEPQRAEFKQRIEAGPTVDDGVCALRGRDFKRILEEEFHVLRELSSVHRLLHQLDYRSLCLRPRHHKADPEQQQAFQRQLPRQLQAIADARPDKTLRIYFEDETRFGQQGTLTRVWAPRGSRPPYSPELNPMENRWHYLNSHYWSNRKYANYYPLEAVAMHAWQVAVLNSDLM